MFDPFFVRLLKEPLTRGAAALAGRGLSANQITWAGFAAGLLGAAAIGGGLYWLAVPLLALNRLADGLDGAVARLSEPTDFGAYLDIVLDFIVYTAVAGAFAIANPENVTPAVVLVASFMGTGASFLAFAVIAAQRGLVTDERGKKSFFYIGGLTEGSETIAFFAIVLFWPHVFPFAAWVFALMCWITIAQRILSAKATFERG
jgi:phosphatidylglycerophosphate synthase